MSWFDSVSVVVVLVKNFQVLFKKVPAHFVCWKTYCMFPTWCFHMGFGRNVFVSSKHGGNIIHRVTFWCPRTRVYSFRMFLAFSNLLLISSFLEATLSFHLICQKSNEKYLTDLWWSYARSTPGRWPVQRSL